MDSSSLGLNFFQSVLAIFYAIAWGMIANVQPRWKAFDWPNFCSGSKTRARILLSLYFLNIAPIFFFVASLIALDTTLWRSDTCYPFPKAFMTFFSVLPAFAVFGFYRLWLSLIEADTERYYHPGPTIYGFGFLPNVTSTTPIDIEGNQIKRMKHSQTNQKIAIAYLLVGSVPFLLTCLCFKGLDRYSRLSLVLLLPLNLCWVVCFFWRGDFAIRKKNS